MWQATVVLFSLFSILSVDTPAVKSGWITYSITTTGDAYSNADSLKIFFDEEVKSLHLFLKGGVEIKTIRRYSTSGNEFELYFLRNDLHEKIIDVDDWYYLDVGWPNVERIPASQKILGHKCDQVLIRTGKEIMMEIVSIVDAQPAQNIYMGFYGIPLVVKTYSEEGYILYEDTEVSFEAEPDFAVEVIAYKETTWEDFLARDGEINSIYKVFGFFTP